MTDVALLTYVPDPFAVQGSCYAVREAEGVTRIITADELSDYPSRIMTYDLPVLVDDLRRLGHSPPRSILDIGDAIRLAVGRSKDDGGERLWNTWSSLKRRFKHREDAEVFELVAISRIDRPELAELTRLLVSALDALRQLWDDLTASLRSLGELDRLQKVEWPLQSLFAYRQYCGVRVDVDGAGVLLTRISAEKYAAYREVAQVLGKSPTELNFWNIHPYLERSDVAHLSEVEAGGRLEDAFEIAASNSRFAASFLSLIRRRRDEAVVRRALGGGERLFPIFSVLGTVSGRILVSDPHLQQLRRTYRSLIVAEPGTRLVYLDYSQFEPGVIAGLSGDGTLIDAYNNGDLYTALSQVLFESADARPTAKRIFLSFLYGMTTDRISALLAGANGSSADREAYAEKIEAFFRAFPGLATYRRSQQEKLLKEGFVSSLLGNRRVRTGQGGLSPREKRWALNQPVQSTASLIFKEALLEIAREFGDERVILPMHDAVLLQLDEDHTLDRQVARASGLMVEAFMRRIPEVKVRVTAGPFAAGIDNA
jgi:DNA polymerase I-like protein with 3'-5' exonuclease and polymerase domains